MELYFPPRQPTTCCPLGGPEMSVSVNLYRHLALRVCLRHRSHGANRVQVYRLVTEDTIEEKVVERAQQKLKLDAMVVQRGMLQGEKKLEKNEMLAAIRSESWTKRVVASRAWHRARCH